MASGGSFRFRVLVGMRHVPLHARSTAVAQTILGSACARIELAPPEVAPVDDDREFFVAAWCLHLRFIPEEKIIFILEPSMHEGPFYHHQEELPGLRYPVRIRIVELQDWSTPEDDDDGHGWIGDDEDDFGDSNHNGYHPGLDDGGRSRGPQTTRFAGAGDDAPRLSHGWGPTFQSRGVVLVGSVGCPFLDNNDIVVGPRVVRVGRVLP